MAFTIPFLCELSVIYESEEIWIPFDSFIALLRKYHKPTDKYVKKYNIQTEVKGHENGTFQRIGNLYIHKRSILRYIFRHVDDLSICKTISNYILEKVIDSSAHSQSIYDIYKQISTLFKGPVYEWYLGDNFVLDEANVPSLYVCHKDNFSVVEWNRIKYFEYHFKRDIDSLGVRDYEKEVKLREQYLEDFRTSIQLSTKLTSLSPQSIHHRLKRKNISKVQNSILVNTGGINVHDPVIIDNNLLEYLDIANNIISVDCTSICSHQPTLHIYLEVKVLEFSEFMDCVHSMKTFLKKHHRINRIEVTFLTPNTFQSLSLDPSERFHIRDEVLLNKFHGNILFEYKELETEIFQEDSCPCLSCFSDESLPPLEGKSFSPIREWFLETPLIIQIIFQSFLNSQSFRKSSDIESLLKYKLKKLYSVYDIVLNVSNRCYTGILQDLYSTELAMNCRSVGTIFSLTSDVGATLSLNASEKKVKEQANSDLCYYNTYLKKYSVTETCEAFNLRGSYLILMLDNLVRLKYHNDPNPGENRSMQICTLPITLKGIPPDCADIKKWHDCQETNCKCMSDYLFMNIAVIIAFIVIIRVFVFMLLCNSLCISRVGSISY